jgi:hypothetical protein
MIESIELHVRKSGYNYVVLALMLLRLKLPKNLQALHDNA